MDGPALAAFARLYLIAISAFGILLLVAYVVRSRLRWRLALAIGITAGAMANIVGGGGEDWLLFARDTGIGAVAGPAGLLVAIGAMALLRRTRLREAMDADAVLLNPHRWQQEWLSDNAEAPPLRLGRAGPLGNQDIARRWFVVTAAATGSVVFSLIANTNFWQALLDSLTPARITTSAVLVIVAVVLIGPIQDFVFDRSVAKGGTEDRPTFAEALTRDRSMRSVLRLLLVFALGLVSVQLLSSCLEASLVSSGSEGALTVLLASETPAIVTFYWCSLLQLRVQREALRQAGTTCSTLAAAIVLYPGAVGLSVALGLMGTGLESTGREALGALLLTFGAPIMGLLIAWLMGYLTAGIYAALGGWVLQRLQGVRAMAALGIALLVGTVVHQTAAAVVLFIFTEEFDWSGYLYLAMSAVGWLIGLIASDFPRIVMAYPQSSRPPAGPATAAAEAEQ